MTDYTNALYGSIYEQEERAGGLVTDMTVTYEPKTEARPGKLRNIVVKGRVIGDIADEEVFRFLFRPEVRKFEVLMPFSEHKIDYELFLPVEHIPVYLERDLLETLSVPGGVPTRKTLEDEFFER